MAVPTISSLSPTSGVTGGRFLVVVQGTNFQLPAAPPATGPAPKPPASVRAWLVAADSTLTEVERVDVVSATQLHVLVPSHDPGVVALRVDNVDASGTTIPGETVTLANALTLRRPMLSGEAATAERILARVVRTLLRAVKREVMENVALTVHTDFDATPADGLNTIEIAELPSLVFVGPQLTNNRFYSSNVPRQVTVPGGFATLRPSRCVDVGFNLLAASESVLELLNIQQEVAAFFERNPYLYVQRDPADASAGRVRYELALTSDPQSGNTPNESNVRQFSAALVVRGVDLDDPNMVVRRTAPIEEVVLTPGTATSGTGAGGDVLVGDGTTDPVTGGPLPWPVYLSPGIYQLALAEEA